MTDEQRELMRRAAQNLLDHAKAGRKVDPHGKAWAENVVASIKPLGRPLTDGDAGLPPALRRGALEVF